MDAGTQNEQSLAEFLSHRARSSSDARLAADGVIGFTIAVGAVFWRGPAWYVISAAGLCFFAYGVWAIADRELRERPQGRGRIALAAARIMATVAGAAAAIAFVLGAMAVIFGRFIS